MAASHLLTFFDTDVLGINLQSPAQAGAGQNYLTVIDFVTVCITNGATAGPNGIQINSPDGQVLAYLASDFEAGATDTIHTEWGGGLPGWRIDTANVASGSGTITQSYYAQQGESITSTNVVSITPIWTDPTDVTFYGTIGYHFERQGARK